MPAADSPSISHGRPPIYNPHQFSHERLASLFVVRRELLARLLDTLRSAPPDQFCVQLIHGVRGMGKTTLLRRLADVIDHEDAGLRKHWLPLLFPEEQYNLFHPAHLVDNWLTAVEVAAERRNIEPAALAVFRHERSRLPKPQDERHRHGWELLEHFARDQNLRLLPLVDNFDLLLNKLKKFGKELRKEWTAAGDWLGMIAATAEQPEWNTDAKSDLKDWKKFVPTEHVHPLLPLGFEEAKPLFAELAIDRGRAATWEALQNDDSRLKALFELTGGNIRTLVLLADVVSADVNGDAANELERLLDEHTGLYKHRLDVLADQAQVIVDALARHWHPMTAGMLSDTTEIDVRTLSGQLDRLVQNGVVAKVPYFNPEARQGFQIAERFFNIWYLMRSAPGCPTEHQLRWLVEFLKAYYGPDGFVKRAERFFVDPIPVDGQRRQQHAALMRGIASQLEPSRMQRDIHFLAELSVYPLMDDTTLGLLQRGFEKRPFGDVDAAVSGLNRVLEHRELPHHLRARGYLVRGYAKWRQGDFKGAVNDYTLCIELPGAPAEQVAWALNSRGISRGQQGDVAGEMSDYTRCIQLPDAPVETAALALNNRGIAKGEQGDVAGKNRDYTRCIELPNAPVEQVAWALNNRGYSMEHQSKIIRAIEDYSKCIYLPNVPKVYLDFARQRIAPLLNSRGFEKGEAGDLDGELADYRLALEYDPDYTVARANLAETLVANQRWLEAVPEIERFLITRDERADTKSRIELFSDIAAAAAGNGYAGRLVSLLETSPARDEFLPIFAALQAVDAGTWKSLRRLAPEVRRPTARVLNAWLAENEELSLERDPLMNTDGELTGA